MRNSLLVVIAVLVLFSCRTFEGEIPVRFAPPEATYISPGQADGVQDELRIDVDVPEIANLYVQGYRFSVTDDQDLEAYVDEVTIPRRPRRRSIELPNELVWNGVDSNGNLLPDGEYTYSVSVWDRSGNEGEVGPYRVVIDNTVPSIEADTSYVLFSPNGDGSLDTLYVAQRNATEEDEWVGTFSNSSGVVRTIRWPGRPTDFQWDGADDARNRLPDGEYQYEVSAKDRAGNSAVATIPGIVIDTKPRMVRIRTNRRAISPNGDGVGDTVEVLPSLDSTVGVRQWKLEIRSILGRVLRAVDGDSTVPDSIIWDGMGEAGAPVPDGLYRAVLEVTYQNGDRPQGASGLITVDTRMPIAGIHLSTPVFSPDGDGLKDTLIIEQSSSQESEWFATITSSTGDVLRQYRWFGLVGPVEWSGDDEAGNPLVDGRYRYELTSTDGAGNTGTITVSDIRIDTRPTPVRISADTRVISPNDDGLFETARFALSADINSEIETWTLEVVDGSEVVRKRFVGRTGSRLPEAIVWNGRWDNLRVQDGPYRGRLNVTYLKGNVSQATTAETVRVDTTGPRIDLYVSPKPFSPDGDGNFDRMSIRADVTDPSGVGAWTATISDPVGNEFKRFQGTGSLTPLMWDGRGDSGELVQSASEYGLIFSVVDSVGNASQRTDTLPIDILVIREGDRLRIIISSIYFERYTANYLNVPEDLAASNIETIDLLAEKLKKYPRYNIRIEGHAVQEYWDEPDRASREETEELIPLSSERARAIQSALIDRGIQRRRLSVAGFGGSRPIVPHSDLENRWKNRRVEFILIRQP